MDPNTIAQYVPTSISLAWVSPVIYGVVTALVWASLVWIYRSYRDCKLRKNLEISFLKGHLGKSRYGYGVSLQNDTHIPVLVRVVSALLVATKDHEQLEAGKPAGSFKMNYTGATEFGASNTNSDGPANERGFIELPPYCGGRWEVPWDAHDGEGKGFFAGKEYSDVEITLEYSTLFKVPMLLVLRLENQETPSGLPGAFNKFMEQGLPPR